EKYDGTRLSACKMEDHKKWNATCPKAAEQLAFFKPYFSELSTLSLENHLLCQTHYNQENPPNTDMDTQTPSYTDLIAELDQAKETEELTKLLQQAYEEVNTYQRLYEDQFERNRALIEQWDSRFSIVDIAKAECESLFDDISKLFEFWELGKKSID
ncbi:33280_t:CDS:2, partial [Gigaspora margarita]